MSGSEKKRTRVHIGHPRPLHFQTASEPPTLKSEDANGLHQRQHDPSGITTGLSRMCNVCLRHPVRVERTRVRLGE